VKSLFGELGRKDRNRLAYGFGLWSPEMLPHWSRLKSERNGHSLVNIGTEWTRLDPQRAVKLGFDAILVGLLAGFFI
jgi:hypothetical protein